MSRIAIGLLVLLGVSGCQERPLATPAPAKPAIAPKPVEQPAGGTADADSKSTKPAPAIPDPAPMPTAETKPAIVPLIPREKLFGNPDKAAARMSHDGKQLSFLAPVDGVLNIWVGPIDDPGAAKAVTADKKRGIRSYFWAYTNEHLLYTQDAGGNEDWNVYCVDLKSGETKNLTDLKNTRAEIESVSYKFPTEIIVGLNDRNPEYHDLYRLNFTTGEKTLIQKNDDYAGFVVDEDYKVRFASKMTEDGGSQLFKNDGDDKWSDFLKIGMEDTLTTQPAGFDKTGEILYLIDSRGRDTGALKTWNLKDNVESLVAENPLCDVGGIMSHPTENTIQGVSFTYERTHWTFFDKAIEADFAALKKIADGEISVASRTLDDKKWIVAFLMDVGPIRYYVYDRATKEAKFLFTNRKSLEGLPLQPMQSHVIPARDGLNLVSYLTIPPGSDTNGDGIPEQPVPLVLNVHGGPWARDDWGFDPEAQLLANRGYAVLNVNFRGSTGFGKKFANAGNKQWALKMHDDLLDAVDWAVKRKVTEDGKIAIMGGSYGGYATLVGLTVTPDKFACGIDIVGPSNILTLLSTIPAYWAPAIQMFKDRVGDFTTEEGKAFLTELSPLTHHEKIKKPLLIAQGANDPRVKQSEADQIVQALVTKKIPVTYVLFPDEGHGFARPNNSLAFNAVTEAFLAVHLGGRYEPIGEAFKGSTITVPSGAADVPGLEKALEAMPKPKASEPKAEAKEDDAKAEGAKTDPAVNEAIEKATDKPVESDATPKADAKDAPKE